MGKQRKASRLKIERVDWIDSCSSQGWRRRKDHDLAPSKCSTVGYVLKENTHVLSLAQSVSDNSVADVMVIPKSCVVRRRRLK